MITRNKAYSLAIFWIRKRMQEIAFARNTGHEAEAKEYAELEQAIEILEREASNAR